MEKEYLNSLIEIRDSLTVEIPEDKIEERYEAMEKAFFGICDIINDVEMKNYILFKAFNKVTI